MSDLSTHRRSAAGLAAKGSARPVPRATRCECQHCHAHTFLGLLVIGDTLESAKCFVCGSYDLVPVKD